MSDNVRVSIKVRRLIEREESEGLVSHWDVKNNSIVKRDGIGDSYTFGE
jgi:hypothetical protein